jgi:hypothetical protein
MGLSSIHTGWGYRTAGGRQANTDHSAYYAGTEVLRYTASTISLLKAVTTSLGVTVTTGDITISEAAGALVATSGNCELGGTPAYATTQPQGAVTMGGTTLNGIAPVGAVATSAGLFASDTVARKIIANGTASNVG